MGRVMQALRWLADEPWAGAYMGRVGFVIAAFVLIGVVVVGCSSAAQQQAQATGGTPATVVLTVVPWVDPVSGDRCYMLDVSGNPDLWSCVSAGGSGSGSAIPTLPPP